MLAWADVVIVSADSVSMVSEAISIGVPVYILGMDHCKGKSARFHFNLMASQLVAPLLSSKQILQQTYPQIVSKDRNSDMKLVVDVINKML
mmetsp:Transcript_8797/g.11930  ORF Transcript_8797/g.11930 Transcript_8797/m.11930 type:complete len:91 (+) Transcript_8797:61-333(+)